ncbi:hypothetical protein L204_100833 [Cryptococcus depauperatus]
MASSPVANALDGWGSTGKRRRGEARESCSDSESVSESRSVTERLGRRGWQEPVRARACGFGNKDRRPLTPTPIVQLIIRDASGDAVDLGLINPSTLILQIELCSVDGQEPRNIVRHPIGSCSTVSKSNHSWTESLDMPSMVAESPRQASRSTLALSIKDPWKEESGWEGPAWTGAFNTVHDRSGSSAIVSSPRQSWSISSQASYTPLQRPGSFESLQYGAQRLPSPPRPSTAPSFPHSATMPRHSYGHALPPLSSIAEDIPDPSSKSHASLYLQRPASGSSQWSKPRTSYSTDSSSAFADYSMRGPSSTSSVSSYFATPDFGYGYRGRPLSSQWSEEPRAGYMNHHRPLTSLEDSNVSPRSTAQTHVSELPYSPVPVSPHTPVVVSTRNSLAEHLPHYFAQPQSACAQVLVGKRHTHCNKLQDENGQMGLFFFVTDLGVRTEGKFRLRMKVVDLSLFPLTLDKERSVPILAEALSESIDVFSAKRFPGVIPTTPLTRLFAAQGIKLAVRESHKKKKQRDDGGEDGEENIEDDEDED